MTLSGPGFTDPIWAQIYPPGGNTPPPAPEPPRPAAPHYTQILYAAAVNNVPLQMGDIIGFAQTPTSTSQAAPQAPSQPSHD